MKKLPLVLFVLLLMLLTSCTKKSLKVTYYSLDEVYLEQEININTIPEAISIEDSKTHYFTGWYLNLEDELPYAFNEEISNDLSLYAKWEPKDFTITFMDMDNRVYRLFTLEYGSTITIPTNPSSKRIGNEIYTFVGWDKEFDVVKEDMIITALYDVSFEYEIVFYDMFDQVLSTSKLTEKNKINSFNYDMIDNLRYDYTFTGWTTSKDSNSLFDFNEIITSDMNFYPVYLKTIKEVDYEGKTISFLGDSITTFFSQSSTINSYYNGTNQYYYPLYSSTVRTVEDTWWYKLTNKLNLRIGINNSWSGSALYNNGSQTNNAAMNMHRINTLKENGRPDIIFIHIGTNDNVSGVTVINFRNSYKTLLSRLQYTYPEAVIFTMTLGYSAYTGYSYTETNRIAYNNIIKEESNNYDTFVVDLANVQTIDNYTTMLGDNLHPNLFGMNEYANYAASEFKKYFG